MNHMSRFMKRIFFPVKKFPEFTLFLNPKKELLHN